MTTRAGVQKLLIANGAVAAGMAFAGWFATHVIELGTPSLLWLPSGVGLAAMWLVGYGVWPGIMLGEWMAEYLQSGTAYPHLLTPWAGMLTNVIGSAAEVLTFILIVWALRHLKITPDTMLTRTRATGWFILISAVGYQVSTCLGVTNLALFGEIPWSAYAANWWLWYIGGVFGILLVTPVILAWMTPLRNARPTGKRVEFVALLFGTLALTGLAFGPYHTAAATSAVTFLILPMLLWAALRFPPARSTTVVLLVAIMAAWGTMHGFSPFHYMNHSASAIMVQVLMATLAGTTLLLSASTLERQQAQADLQTVAEGLEDHVTERTGQLKEANAALRDENTQRQDAETKLAHANRMLRMLSNGNQILIRAQHEQGLLDAVCHSIVDDGGYRMAWIGLLRQEGDAISWPAASAGVTDGYLDFIEEAWELEGDLLCPTAAAMQRRAPFIISDMLTDPQFAPWRDEALSRGYRAMIALPLLFQEHLLGTLNLYWDTPTNLDIEEIRLLEELAADLAYGINTLRTRTALAANEERYRTLYNAIDEGIFINTINPGGSHGNFVEVNEVGCQRLGYTCEELRHMSPRDIDLPISEGGTDPLPALAELSAGREATLEQVHRTKDGRRLYVEIHAKPFHYHGNAAIFAVHRDITERKRAEDAQRQSEAKLRAIFAAMTDVVLVMDARGRYLEVAPTNPALLYKPPMEILGKTIYDIFPPAEADFFFEHITRALATGTPEHFEYVLPINGQETWFSAILSPLDHERLLLVARDITERKEMENALRQERAFLATSFEILPLPLMFVTPSQEIVRFNQAGVDMLRMPDLQSWWDVPLASEGSPTPIPQHERPALRALRGETTNNQELLITFPDGREVPALFHAAPVYINNKLVAAVVAFQDITKLKEADLAKDQFLMVLSHELKTPLTSIRGWAQAAQKLPDTVPQALEIIIRNADEQAKILGDLLDVSRMITGHFTVVPEPSDLCLLVHHAVENTLQEADAHRVQIIESASPDPLPIDADPGRLNQALDNLLYNAIKFTDLGGSITVRTFRRDHTAVVEIQDTGRGIEPGRIADLFRPFTQLHREEAKGGLGLGLSLVKGIIAAHGGQVTAASPGPGQGSTFTISLPLDERSRHLGGH